MVAKTGGGDFVGAVGHRRGGKVHSFIFTAGTTLAGKPMVYTIFDDDSYATHEIERKTPAVLNDYTLAQPAIDKNNRYRQRILAMEKRFITNDFAFRFLTYMVGQVGPPSLLLPPTHHPPSPPSPHTGPYDASVRV